MKRLVAIWLAVGFLFGFGAYVWAQIWSGDRHLLTSPIAASYPASHFGGALAEESIRDSSTVMYCDFNDPLSTDVVCGPNAIKHGALGPFSSANYFQLTGLVDGNQTLCILFRPLSIGTRATLFSSGIADKGWDVYLDATGHACEINYYTGAPTCTAGTVAVNGVNLVCAGNGDIGNSAGIQLNGGTIALDSDLLITDDGTGALGRDLSDLYPLAAGVLLEVVYSSQEATAAAFNDIWAAAPAIKTDAQVIPNLTGERFRYRGTGYTAAANWTDLSGNGRHAVLNGSVVKSDVKLSWPALVWTENGTVPSVTQSNLYPSGFGEADSNGAGPFSDANYYSQATTATLNFAGAFSCCMVFDAVDWTSQPVILQSGDGGGAAGWFAEVISPGKLRLYGSTGTTTGVDTLATSGPHVGCWGFDGTNLWMAVDGETPVSAAGTITAATSKPAYLGRYSGAGSALNGNAYELWCSSTAATSAVFSRLHRTWAAQESSTRIPITVTRTTQATSVVDGRMYRTAPGQIRTVPEGRLIEAQVVNTALYSEQFDQAATWVDTHGGASDPGSTVPTADQGTGLDGAMTADRLVVPEAADADDYTALCQDFTATAAVWTGNVWVKTASGTAAPHVYLWDGAAAYHATLCAATTTYSTCTVTSSGNLTAATWKLCVGHDRRDAAQTSGAAATFLAWGAQIEVAPFLHQYCGPTTTGTRTCNADAVTVPNPLRPQGSDWTNSLLQSEDFSTTWTNSNTAETVNVVLAPDGSFTADLVYENDTTDSTHYVTQTYTATAVPWTCSGWAKAEDRSYVVASADAGTSGRYFDLTTCAVGDAVGAGTTGAVTAASDGWCRIAVTKTMGAGATSARVYLASGAGTYSYPGEVGKGVWLWGFQCEPASSASPYCPTTTAAATCGPGGATGKASANELTSSEAICAGAWACVRLTNQANTSDTLAPDGTQTAERWTDTVDNDTHSGYQVLAGSEPHTASVHAKAGTGTWMAISSGSNESYYTFFDVAACTVGTTASGCLGQATSLSNGWCRISATCAASSGSRAFRLFMASADGVAVYAGGTNTYYVWGAQFQGPSSPTPTRYCATTTAAVPCGNPTQRWCVRVKDALPESGVSWAATAARDLVSSGSGDNSFEIYSTAADVTFVVKDAGAISKYIGVSSGFTTSAGTVTACAVDGVLSLCFGSSCSTPAATGSGTGLISAWPTTVLFGDGPTARWDGYIGSLDFNTTGDPKDFLP